jgi:phage-related protein
MALGFLLLDGSTVINPDRNLARETKPRVLYARFGDGYEQRMANGINNLDETYNITFVTRPKAEIDDIAALFDSKKAVTAFNFTIPDSNAGGEKVIKVVCEDYTIEYNFYDYYSISARFRRVYE